MPAPQFKRRERVRLVRVIGGEDVDSECGASVDDFVGAEGEVIGALVHPDGDDWRMVVAFDGSELELAECQLESVRGSDIGDLPGWTDEVFLQADIRAR